VIHQRHAADDQHIRLSDGLPGLIGRDKVSQFIGLQRPLILLDNPPAAAAGLQYP
jgi:hypothetical protein